MDYNKSYDKSKNRNSGRKLIENSNNTKNNNLHKANDNLFQIFDIGVDSVSKEKKINIDPVITNWTNYLVEMQINFEEPLVLSRVASGNPPDVFTLKIKDGSYFESEETGIKLNQEIMTNGLTILIPR